MGKPYRQELEALSSTYDWALKQESGPLVEALRPLWNYPLIVIGSGGSLSAAHFASVLHESQTRNLATVCTPLEFAQGSPARSAAGILLMSAGGRNPDILNAAWEAIKTETRWLTILCGTKATPLAKLSKSCESSSLYEYSIPCGKDGFLATNSLIAAFVMLLRAYGVAAGLPSTLEELLGTDDVLSFFEKTTIGDVQEITQRETVVVLYGPATKSAALDLESKLTEAALARVQLADYRNFAHGRHHWLAKRGGESSVIAFRTPEERDLCDRTLALLPPEIPRLVANFPSRWSGTPLQALLYTFVLTQHYGAARGIDPGRPSVPEFGRKLYHLQTRRKQKSPDILETAINRKLKAADIPPTFADERFWREAATEQFANLHEPSLRGIVFDYDGTLCSSDRRLQGPSNDIALKLQQLLQWGVVIGVATGRGQSVRKDLQKYIPEKFWPSVLIGYYNGSDISNLADDNAPDRSEVLVELLKLAYENLKNDRILADTCKWTLRSHQITIEPRSWLTGPRMWNRVRDVLRPLNCEGVRVVLSTHSIDIIAPTVSKLNLVKKLAKLKRFRRSDKILCIGDRGKWPGNDHELLSHPFSLSTDEVSSDPQTGWNFAPAGCRGASATFYYLDHLKVEQDAFRLQLERNVG